MSSPAPKGNLLKTVGGPIVLAVVLVIACVALYYAIQDKRDIESLRNGSRPVERMVGNGNNINDQYAQMYGDPNNIQAQRTYTDASGKQHDWWNTNSRGHRQKVVDGADATNSYSASAQSQCKPVAVAEAYAPHTSLSSTSPSPVSKGSAYAASYPDETAANSLAGKGTYSCAPDTAAGGGCDYALNPDNLMPGSWREGVGCADGTDPNSQWAKYHPTRDKYYRYITAAGSARLGVNTRNSIRKVVGIPNLLMAASPTPLSNNAVPFSDSSHRQTAIATSTGSHPSFDNC